jgi:nitrogen regulatory protein P-II 1
MKKIEAIIQPGKLGRVREALEASGYTGITMTVVRGQGKQKGIAQNWKGKEYRIGALPKVKLEVVVSDQKAEAIVKAILKAAGTGHMGDGKIFVQRIDGAFRISSGEAGDTAVS